MRLTDTALKRFKAGPSFVDVNDDGTPLVARIKANGQKIFIWRGRIDGKQTKKIIGEFPEMSVDEARITALAMKKDARKVKAAPPVVVNHKIITLSKAFDRYMKEYAEGLASAPNIEGQFRLRILPVFGAREIKTITRKEINAHFNVIKHYYNGAGINRVLAQFKAFLNWCVREDIIDFSPAAQIQPKVKETPRKRVLRDHELGYLQMALADMEEYHAPLMLLLHTSTRLSDIFSLRWCEVLPARDELLIETTKTGVSHMVHLTKQAQKYLPERPANAKDSHFVFKLISRHRSSWYLDKIRKLTSAYAAKDGKTVQHFTIHDFRTAVATYLSEQNGRGHHRFSDRALDMLLAHAPKGITARIYNHSLCLDERKEMLTIWSNHLDACLGMVTK